jgi:hypothetical protein
MIGNGWVLVVENVQIHVQFPCTVNLEISPGEKALLDKGVLDEQDLIVAYRHSIERGSFRHYNITGG